MRAVTFQAPGVVSVEERPEPELIAATKWAGGLLRNPDDLLRGGATLRPAAINDAVPEGRLIANFARQVLGKGENDEITFAEAATAAQTFAGKPFNGDGIIPADTAGDDATKVVIADIINCLGADLDASGLRDRASIEPGADELGMVLAGRWYRLMLRPETAAESERTADPLARLPVTLLARNIIEPIFGVTDPRRDKRIDFVGGGRGLEELHRLVSSGQMAVAFALYPTQMHDLMAVADAGAIMPPKSTWFEPKLADGMVSHMLD